MKALARNIIDSFAAGSLGISAVLTALRPTTKHPGLRTMASDFNTVMAPMTLLPGDPSFRPSGDENLLGIAAQPTNPVLWALLIAVLAALVLHILLPAQRLGGRMRGATRTAGLLAGAVWPWVVNPMPLLGLTIAVLSILMLVHSLSWPTGRRPPWSRRMVSELPVAFVAGWLMMSACSSLAMYVHVRLGLGLERSVLLGMLIASLAGAWAQLRLEGAVTWSLALIWAMIGFAAAAAGASITIATACVLGIAALTVVVVRVTT